MVFVAVTTLYAGWRNIFDNFLPLTETPGKAMLGYVNITLSAIIMFCAIVVLIESFRRWYVVLLRGKYTRAGETMLTSDSEFRPPEFGEV